MSAAASTAGDGATFVTIGGTRYAFGLAWRVLAGVETRSVADEARSMAQELGRTTGLTFVDQNKRRLCGFASDKTGRGAHAAAVLAAGFPKRRLVVLRVAADKLWVCIAGDGSIDVDTDLICDLDRAEQLVQSAFTQAKAKSKDLDVAIGPDTGLESPWLEGVEPMPVARILPLRDGVDARVRNLSPMPVRTKAMVLIAVALPAGLASYEYYQHVQRREAARAELEAAAAARNEAAELAENAALRDAAMKKAVLDALVGDTAGPAPADAYRACSTLARQLSRGAAGWHVTQLRCEPAVNLFAFDATIEHPARPNYGTPGALTALASELGGTVSMDAMMRSATVSLPIDGLTPRPGIESVDSLPGWDTFVEGTGTALLRRSRAQVSFTYSIVAPAPRPIQFVDPTAPSVDGTPVRVPVPEEATYREARIDIASPFGPAGLIDHLTGTNARVTSIVFDPQHPLVTLTLTVLVK